MPPRYVYWTIIVDGQPTAFRSGSLEDIMPTFNRLKEKQPTAELKWWQNGQLWPSRHDAQDFMRARGERGRAKDPRQSGGDAKPERAWNAKPEWKTRSTFKSASAKAPARQAPDDKASTYAKAPVDKPEGKPEWKPKGSFTPAPRRDASLDASGDDKPKWKPKGDKPAWKPASAKASARQAPSWGEGEDRPAGQARSDRKPEWKPKGTFKPKEAGHASGWGEKPAFAKATARQAPKWTGDKPAWKGKPSGSARDQARSSFRPKSFTPKDEGAGPTRSAKAREQKLDWTPASARPSTYAKAPADRSARQAPDSRPPGPNAGFAKSDPDAPKRKWVPKAEYKKSLGIEAKRDDKWRPGGEHVDPKQKYKDAKKAKWTKFKANIRSRSSKPRKD